jgi:nicotinate-nucleotide adenylyltransferase
MTHDRLAIGKRLLVYGGTFDPPHRAHVELPFVVKQKLGFDGVIFVPAGQPPHKPDPDRTAGEHRLAMLEAALDGRADAAVCTWELSRAGPSYTYQTIEQLHEHLGPGVEMRLLIGADMALIFDKWVRPEVIERFAEPVVMVRPPHGQRSLLARLSADRWAGRLVEVPPMDISSTALRERLRSEGVDDSLVREAVPPAVLTYIASHGLYPA